MNTIIYNLEQDFETFDKTISERRETDFFRIEKAFEFNSQLDDFHVIYLVSIDKKSFKELRTPLAYYIGKENNMTIIEEELIIQNANARLYSVLKNINNEC